MNDSKKEILSYLQNLSLLITGVILLAFPLVFSILTTDAFALPKQIVLTIGVIIALLIIGIRMIVDGKVKLRTTPFDLPLLLFTIVTFVSSYLSINRYDALTAFVPLLFAILLFFVIVNVVKTDKAVLFVVSALILGALLSTLVSVLSFFKIFIIPLSYTHVVGFTPFGSLLDQAIYLAIVVPFAGYIAWPIVNQVLSGTDTGRATPFGANETKNTSDPKVIAFAGAFIVMILCLAITVYMLITFQKPLILPFETGFQTAFAAASQDTGRVLKSFLLGSGYGTYLVDFTRFKLQSYNANANLWSFSFFRSSSYILELLATTGFLGILSFLFIIYRVIRQKTFFLPIILVIIAAFFLPFSPVLQTIFFIVLGLFAALLALQNPHKFPELEFHFVAFKDGLVNAVAEHDGHSRRQPGYGTVLPIALFVVLLLVLSALSYFSGLYILSDVTFQKSLVAAAQNDGLQTYNLEISAIQMFPYRDAYYRTFSQTNLALANSLASSQPKNSSPSAQVQSQVLQLIQQAINSGRSAVTVAPQTAMNWNNLSSIYRSLIGFGQNADQFSIVTNNQAIALDPSNPQQYINLGGIYYQLGQWADAQREFSIATQLKPDYANAYYNLGHALEANGNLTNALSEYQLVKQLIGNDKNSLKQIDTEIAAIQKKIGSQANQQAQTGQQAATNQPPLSVDQPAAQLPGRNPQEKIPGPTLTPLPTPTTQPTTEGGLPTGGGLNNTKTTTTPSPVPTK